MKKLLLLLSLFPLTLHTLSAQALDSICVRETMNSYIQYVNDNIHALGVWHKGFEKLNTDLNDFHEASPSEQEGILLVYNDKNLLENLAFFEDETPVERYRKILQIKSCIPAMYMSEIHGHAEQVKDISNEIAGISKRLQTYIKSQSYRSDPEQKTAYQLLSRCHVLYHDFSVLKDVLYYDLSKLYRNFEDPGSSNPYLLSTRELMRIIVPARAVLRGLKEDSPNRVRNNLSRIQNAINRAQANTDRNLKGVTDQTDVKGAWKSYFYVTAVAEDFIAAAREYLQSDRFPEKYHPYGKSYYYYNNRQLKVFNRLGEGMILRYNRIVELADIMLLKTVEEPHWYRLIQPEAQREDTLVIAKVEPTEEPIDTVVAEVKPAEPEPTLEGVAANNLILLLDVSSSMKAEDRLPLLKNSFKHLLDLMRPEDKVSIITYSGEAKVALPSTSSSEKERIITAIDGLRSEGKTNALNGLVAAYRMAQRNFIPEGNNRIIMASDGYFKIVEALPRLVKTNTQKNILLSVFYYGEENPQIAERLNRLANIGGGNYRHITVDNANLMLIEEARGL